MPYVSYFSDSSSQPNVLIHTRSVCDLVPFDGNPQPNSWESTADNECAIPCLGNASEACGGIIQKPGIEGQISGYTTCDFVQRC